MTTCELIMKPIVRMVEKEKKDLDQIASSVCPKIEYGREKIIRVIKDFLGEEYLIEHAETLKYNVEMAELAKKRKPSKEKILTTADKDSGDEPFDKLVKKIKYLAGKYGMKEVIRAVEEAQHEET